VVRINADILLLGIERKLAKRLSFELVMGLKIWPAPNSTVNYMRKAFTMGNLSVKI